MKILPLKKWERPEPFLTCWEPETDLYRAKGKWLLKMNLAGVDPSQIVVECSENTVTVQGIRKDVTPQFGFVPEEIEIPYSRFYKEVRFPCKVELEKEKQSYENGMLFVGIIAQI